MTAKNIDYSKSENVLRARKVVKRFEGIPLDQINDSKVISLEELRDFVVEYGNLLYNKPLQGRNLTSDRVYHIAENLIFESRRISEKRTKEEFEISIKIEMLKSADEEKRNELIKWIDEKIVEYEITEDSPVRGHYENALSKSIRYAERKKRERERLRQEGEDRTIAYRHGPKSIDDIPMDADEPESERVNHAESYSEEYKKKLEKEQKERKKEREKKEMQEELEKKKFLSKKHKQAVKRAEDVGKFWPELVDYVFWRLKRAGTLELGFNIGFPQKVEKGYDTSINYSFIHNKSFRDVYFEATNSEVNSNGIRKIRKNAFQKGKENLETMLNLSVVKSAENRLDIMGH